MRLCRSLRGIRVVGSGNVCSGGSASFQLEDGQRGSSDSERAAVYAHDEVETFFERSDAVMKCAHSGSADAVLPDVGDLASVYAKPCRYADSG